MLWLDSNQSGDLWIVDQSGNVKVDLNSSGNSYLTGGNVGIGTTTPLATLDVNGAASISGNLTLSGASPTIATTLARTLTLAANVNIGAGGTGKLTAGTWDPIYNINGVTYATYGTGMTGVKEETVGIVNISEQVPGQDYYQYVIDFNNLEEASDLWLFSKTTNLRQNINQLVVLLSPAGRISVWYQVDPVQRKLIFYSSSPTALSYRLTAPRFDYLVWGNLSEDQSLSGFVIDDNGDLAGPSGSEYTFNENNNLVPQASASASIEYILANDPLFKDTQTKITDLQSKLDTLSQKVDQVASISAFLLDVQNGQVLGASTSASLIDSLGDIEIKSATISGDLMVMGRTTVTDLGVTGNINAGVLAIHGLDGEINTLAGDLYLQKDGLNGVDILDGKVVIDTDGNMTVAGTIAADTVESNKYTVLGDQSIGSASISAGLTFVDVPTPVATTDSKIFLTPTSLTDRQLTVISKLNGKFRVAIPTSATTPITFDWWIVGNK